MPITDLDGWTKSQSNNQDPYGKACVDVARRVMDILDTEGGAFDANDLICRADDEVKAGGITGFMAGCVASMVSHFHSRGAEFKKSWNHEYGVESDVKGVVNPAILTVKTVEGA